MLLCSIRRPLQIYSKGELECLQVNRHLKSRAGASSESARQWEGYSRRQDFSERGYSNNDAFEKNSWYFRNALVRANYNDLQNGVHAATKFLEMFFSNLILDTNYELKNRYMHVDYKGGEVLQSITPKVPKSQFDTLECTLEELAEKTGKSIATIKRIMKSLQDKQYIRRESGKRYGKWEILV